MRRFGCKSFAGAGELVQGAMNGNAGNIVEQIQEEIMNNGSVSAVLTVYWVGSSKLYC